MEKYKGIDQSFGIAWVPRRGSGPSPKLNPQEEYDGVPDKLGDPEQKSHIQ